jgi:hypothetical protein
LSSLSCASCRRPFRVVRRFLASIVVDIRVDTIHQQPVMIVEEKTVAPIAA